MAQPSDDEQGLLAACVAATDAAMAVVDARGADLPLVYVNAAFERVTGYGAADASGGGGRFLAGTRDPESTDAVLQALRAGHPAHARLLTARPDGGTFWNDVHATPVRDAGGAVTHFVSVQRDITEQVAAETRSAYAATHDSLTGLANRSHFAEQLERELARSRRDRRSLAVLFLDVDHFKAANDAYGHAVGDALLVEAAHRLGTRLRGQDMAARHGGDEFLAMLVDLPGDGADGADVVADELERALAETLEIDGTEHRLSVSIGVSLYPRDADTATALIAHADAAMYREKARRATGGALRSRPGRGAASSAPSRPRGGSRAGPRTRSEHYLVRSFVALSLAMLVAGGVEYAVAAEQLSDRAHAQTILRYQAHLTELEDALSVDQDPQQRVRVIEDGLERIDHIYGALQVGMFDPSGQPVTAAEPGEPATINLERVAAVVSTGQPTVAPVTGDDGPGQVARFEYLLPVETPEGVLVLQVYQREDIITGQVSDLRVRKALGLAVALLSALPLTYALGGRMLHRRQLRLQRASDMGS